MSSLPNRSLRRRGFAVLVVAALVLPTIGVVTRAPAQPHAGPLADILATLSEILAVLKPAPAPVVLSTGVAVALEGEAIRCSFANVGTTAIPNVITRVVRWDGTIRVETDPHSVDAGTAGGGLTLCCGDSSSSRCEFSFEGVPSSVRAHMEIGPSDSATMRVILEAR